MNLRAKRLYFGLVGAAVLALGALLTAAYGADMLLQRKADVVRKARLDNLVLEQQQQKIAKAKADVEKHQELADTAKHIVPQDKDQAQTVREIVNIAEAHNIKLGSITFPSSSLGSKDDQRSQLKEVKNTPGVFSLDIAVQSASGEPATYDNFLAFLDALEHNRRTALIKSISLRPNSTDANLLSFTLTLQEYIKP